MKRATFAAVVVITTLSRVGGGQPVEPEAEAPVTPPQPEVRFEIDAGVWLPRLGGTTKLGSGRGLGSIDIEQQLDLDNSETVPYGEVTVRVADSWQLRGGGFDFSTSTDGRFVGSGRFGDLELAPGDRYRASVDMLSASLEGGFDVLRGVRSAGAELRFKGRVGLRYVEVEQEVVQIGVGREDADGQWVAPIAGLEMRLHFEPETLWPLDLEAGIAAGPAFGGDGGFVWEVRVNATLEVVPNAALLFGYRLVELDTEDGDYEFDAGLQGLFLGGSVRF